MPEAPVHASTLIKDLSHVPNIIGGLGLSIAAAQKAFNLDYLDGLERVLALTRMLLGGKKEGGDLTSDEQARLDAVAPVIKQMIELLAPSRYQFTETTLSVKLDLAQSLDVGGSAGLGVGYGALSLNAAFTVGYSFDYRAAAECRTVIHAYPTDPVVLAKLLDRAKELNDKSLELPARSEVDQAILTQSANLLEKMIGVKPPAAKPLPPGS